MENKLVRVGSTNPTTVGLMAALGMGSGVNVIMLGFLVKDLDISYALPKGLSLMAGGTLLLGISSYLLSTE